jgi:hypothetical protein
MRNDHSIEETIGAMVINCNMDPETTTKKDIRKNK